MFVFDLKKSRIYRAITISQCPCFRFMTASRKILLLGFVVFTVLFGFGFLGNGVIIPVLSHQLGLALLCLSFGIMFWQIELFFNLKLKNPDLEISIEQALSSSEDYNAAEFLDFEAGLAINESLKLCAKKKSELDTLTIFASLLSQKFPLIAFVFQRLLLSQKDLTILTKKELAVPLPLEQSQDFNDFIKEALTNAKNHASQRITLGNIIAALAKINPFFKKILVQTDLKAEDVDNLCWWWETNSQKYLESKKFWERKNLAKKGGFARDWAAGYTITLDKYAIDWTRIVEKKKFEEIVGHENEVSQIERILARADVNNVLVVGEVGSGRGALLQALTQKVLFGESLEPINYKRVLELDLPTLLGQCQSLEEAGRILEQIFQEVLMATNIILVIQNFEQFVGNQMKPGTIDISGVISNYLKIPSFRVIAITNFAGFRKFVEPSQIYDMFIKVEVQEVTANETIKLLELFVPGWEKKYKKFIAYATLRELVSKAERYLPALPFPKKATDLMTELLAAASANKEPVILPKDVSQLISEKINVPVGQLSIKEREVLLNLENLLHLRIVNQEEAVKEVSSSLRRARSDITIRKGPMGTFLFLGPTGVGKTETAKALAAIYFGNEEKIIRVDMSEFQNPQDLQRLIGSADQESFFVNQVRESPFSLVLLDEIEKAHPNILNLFLQVFDEGAMRDGLGRRVSFLNTIIIATSNAAYQLILEAIGKLQEISAIKEKLLNYVLSQGIFRPEFLNRFDSVVIYKSLTKENLLAIAEMLLQKLKKNIAEKGIDLIITPELEEEVARLGFDPIYGARQMRRVIQDRVENVLASALLADTIARGSRIKIEVPEFKIVNV